MSISVTERARRIYAHRLYSPGKSRPTSPGKSLDEMELSQGSVYNFRPMSSQESRISNNSKDGDFRHHASSIYPPRPLDDINTNKQVSGMLLDGLGGFEETTGEFQNYIPMNSLSFASGDSNDDHNSFDPTTTARLQFGTNHVLQSVDILFP